LKILVGFETGTGSPISMDLHHLAIFGMTQLSGKTTALEAFISRSGLMAIAFRTKRGETGFTQFSQIPAYYRPRADWVYLESLIDAALHERVKFEPGMRGAIMRVTRGSKDLEDVQQRCEEQASTTRGAFMRDVYEKLGAYLKLIVPEIQRHTFSDRIELSKGVNVMDLTAMRRETQSLVIASSMEYVMEKMKDVVVVVPEAWEHIPQGRRTPVSLSAEAFIRKGAGIGNYLWIDSQDIGGVDKTVLRQVDNWLLGRMREAHEVERVIKQLLGLKLKPQEIQTLGLGHFFAAIGNKVYRIYALPATVPEEAGRRVALGEISPEDIRDRYITPQAKRLEGDDLVWKERYDKEVPRLKEEITRLEGELEKATAQVGQLTKKASHEVGELQTRLKKYEDLKRALAGLLPQVMPAPAGEESLSVALTPAATNIVLKPAQVESIQLSAVQGMPGKVLQVVVEDGLAEDGKQFIFSRIRDGLSERGWDPGTGNINIAIAELIKRGIFLKEEKGRYRIPGKLKILRE